MNKFNFNFLCSIKNLIITPFIVYHLFFNSAYGLYDVSDELTRMWTEKTFIETANTYKKQVEQLQLEIDNAEKLLNSEFNWSDANLTISELLDSIDTISKYQGELEEYLSQYQDLEYYQSSACFSSSGCSEEEMADIQNNKITSSNSQKEANDAMIHGLILQQNNLKNDAQELSHLQSKATTAQGQMEAIQYASQLASSQANQLMHIRGLLIAQQTAAAARAQEIADRKAQQEAASLQLREGEYQNSPERNWLGVMP